MPDIDGWFYIQVASKIIIHHILIFDQFVSPNHIEDSIISVVDSHITQGSPFRLPALGHLEANIYLPQYQIYLPDT